MVQSSDRPKTKQWQAGSGETDFSFIPAFFGPAWIVLQPISVNPSSVYVTLDSVALMQVLEYTLDGQESPKMLSFHSFFLSFFFFLQIDTKSSSNLKREATTSPTPASLAEIEERGRGLFKEVIFFFLAQSIAIKRHFLPAVSKAVAFMS